MTTLAFSSDSRYNDYCLANCSSKVLIFSMYICSFLNYASLVLLSSSSNYALSILILSYLIDISYNSLSFSNSCFEKSSFNLLKVVSINFLAIFSSSKDLINSVFVVFSFLLSCSSYFSSSFVFFSVLEWAMTYASYLALSYSAKSLSFFNTAYGTSSPDDYTPAITLLRPPTISPLFLWR